MRRHFPNPQLFLDLKQWYDTYANQPGDYERSCQDAVDAGVLVRAHLLPERKEAWAAVAQVRHAAGLGWAGSHTCARVQSVTRMRAKCDWHACKV